MFTSIKTKYTPTVYSTRSTKARSTGHESSRSTSCDSRTDGSAKRPTPYRLPRLPLDTDEPVCKERSVREVEKVYGRFGFEYVKLMKQSQCIYDYAHKKNEEHLTSLWEDDRSWKKRLPELKPATPSELISPQRLLSQRYRQVALVPRLRTADVLPEYRHTPSLDRERTNSDDDVINRFSFEQRNHESERNGTARSNSVQWKLGQVDNSIFDITGQTHVQGPFSRGFKVRCKAPPSWMKMKWGRSKTVIV